MVIEKPENPNLGSQIHAADSGPNEITPDQMVDPEPSEPSLQKQQQPSAK